MVVDSVFDESRAGENDNSESSERDVAKKTGVDGIVEAFQPVLMESGGTGSFSWDIYLYSLSNDGHVL